MNKTNDTILKTSADDLYELVMSRKKISVEEAAKILKIPINITQSLVDFLVEENIFGMEYKFTTPYVYLSQEKKIDVNLQSRYSKNMITKEVFFQKAKKWNISFEKVNDLWKRYISEKLDSIKKEFYIKAHSRKLQKEKIDKLWNKYLTYLQ